LLAYVFLEDGTNVNEYLIRNGYAYEYTYGVPYTYQTLFKEAQLEAQKEKRGLWADGVCAGE
jgi:micrococcal nuclease